MSKYNPNQCLDIMVDIETLGNSTSPIITQLSAVPFILEDNKSFPEDAFNKFIKPQSCSKVGLTCDRGEKGIDLTIDWWLKQDEEVFNKVILKAFTDGENISEVLVAFTQWLQDMMKKHNCRRIKVYGNGPAADCVWIRSAYLACNMTPPWKFWEDVCVRTYVDMAQRALGMNVKKDTPFVGDKHNAIDDCIYQITMVQSVFNRIKGTK